MDPLTLTSIAAPFVAKGAEAFSKSAGEELGAKVGELCKVVIDKFRGDSDAEGTLALAQKRPDSKGQQSALEEILAEKLKSDPDFASKVQRLVDELEKDGGSTAFNQRGQTVHGSQNNIAGNVLFDQSNGPVSLGGEAVDMRDSKGAILRSIDQVDQQFGDRYYYYPQKGEGSTSFQNISNTSEHLLRLSKLKEWKDMHTETQVLLNILSNVVRHLDRCQYISQSNLNIPMKSAEQEWGNCSPLLKKLENTIIKFNYISSEYYVVLCLDHTHLSATVSHMIFEAKNPDDARNIERYIGAVKNDFEAALLIADKEIVRLVDEITLELTKDLKKETRENE